MEKPPFHPPTAMVLAIAGIVCSATAQAAVVTPSSMGNWAATPTGGGITAISSTFPRNGNGSVEITLPTTSAEVDWIYTLAAPVPLSTFASGSYDYYRDGSSTNPDIQAPAYALWIDNDCNTGTTADQAYLVYEPYYRTLTQAPTNQWVAESVTPASPVWQGGGGVAWSSQPLSSYMNGTATGGTSITGSSCIVGVVPFAGSGWTGAFHGAIDSVTLTAGGVERVNANFELAPPAPVAVPVLSPWGLGLMAALLGALGLRRTRRSAARG